MGDVKTQRKEYARDMIGEDWAIQITNCVEQNTKSIYKMLTN